MSFNPFMKKLGLSVLDRAVIVHVDDVGMCLSSIEAFFELYDFGTVTSGSLMAPCPWFPGWRAAVRRADVDVGIHATLTSEWKATAGDQYRLAIRFRSSRCRRILSEDKRGASV